jgi:hypothetical protein
MDKALENILIAYFPREIREKDQEELKEIWAALHPQPLPIESHVSSSSTSWVAPITSHSLRHTIPSLASRPSKKQRCVFM